MKNVLKSLQKGQSISVTVIEIQDDRQFLVAYHGALFRVKNTSGRRFSVGDSLFLVVTQVSPVEFSLAGESRLFSRVV